jgi:hypothetical protein
MINKASNDPNFRDPQGRPNSADAIQAKPTQQLTNLITLGRERGYVLEWDLANELAWDGLTQDQRDNIAAMLPEMGIPVFDEPPSADALAAARESIEALSHKSTTDRSTAAVPELHVGAPVGNPFIVIHVGAEGGDLRLIAQKTEQGLPVSYVAVRSGFTVGR